jgi:hypothetical protein
VSEFEQAPRPADDRWAQIGAEVASVLRRANEAAELERFQSQQEAEALRVEARRDGDRLREQAHSEIAEWRQQARIEAQALRDEARAERDRAAAEGAAEAERIVAAGREQADEIVADARAKAEEEKAEAHAYVAKRVLDAARQSLEAEQKLQAASASHAEATRVLDEARTRSVAVLADAQSRYRAMNEALVTGQDQAGTSVRHAIDALQELLARLARLPEAAPVIDLTDPAGSSPVVAPAVVDLTDWSAGPVAATAPPSETPIGGPVPPTPARSAPSDPVDDAVRSAVNRVIAETFGERA